MNIKTENQVLSAYNGVPIRCKHLKTGRLINVTDIKKANNASSKYRFDRWRADRVVQDQLALLAKKGKITPIKNKKGIIMEVPGLLEIVSGGDRSFQGTYLLGKLAIAYAEWISVECSRWLEVTLSEQTNSEVIRAEKVDILLGNIEISVYQIPNGEYRLSQIQIAEIVNAGETSFRDFLRSKSPEALPYKGSRFVKIQIDNNNAQPKAIPIKIAAAYWTKESIKGNKKASRLLGACAVESIERRADKAFGKEITEERYNIKFAQTYESIIADCPVPLIQHEEKRLKIAVYEGDARKVKRLYPKGVIPEFTTKERIKERLISISAYDECEPWKLVPGRELYRNQETNVAKCPDFVSNVIEINEKKVVFIYQIYAKIIGCSEVEKCIGRRYTRIAKKQHKVDYSFLFLVSPLGANVSAKALIQEELEIGDTNIGILTVRQLAEFYYALIENEREGRRISAGIKKTFEPFLKYKIVSPLEQAAQLTIPFAS